MAKFRIILIEHGYPTTDAERNCIASYGGELIDCDEMPVEESLRMCHEADGVLVRRMTLSRDILASHFRNVKVIARYGVGVDNIDVQAATELGIIVSRALNYGTEEVSDHAIALLLAGARGIVERHQVMLAGGWDVLRTGRVRRLAECTFGLLAFGQIGRCAARKLGSWNARVIAHDPFIDRDIISNAGVEPVDFDTLIAESDFLSIHAPLLPETHHLIDASVIEKMKRGSMIVNTARGGLIDSAALLAALESGHLAGAALDVFEEEPLPPNDPLRKAPNIVLTDHAAWYSETGQYELQASAAEAVSQGAMGNLPASIANPDVLDLLGRRDEWPGDSMSGWMARRKETLGL